MERIEVIFTASDEMQAMREKVKRLEAELVEARAQRDRADYLFRCESIISQELVDLCRASGVKYRPSIEGRPKE